MLWTVWLAVVSALLLSCCFAFLARRLAPWLRLVDYPDGGRKRHTTPTPLMGGVAIYLALLVSVGLVTCLDGRWFADDSKTPVNILMLLVSGSLFCVLGLADDRWPMRARSPVSVTQRAVGMCAASAMVKTICARSESN